MEAIWIESHKKAEAEAKGYMVVEPEQFLQHISAEHLFRECWKVNWARRCSVIVR